MSCSDTQALPQEGDQIHFTWGVSLCSLQIHVSWCYATLSKGAMMLWTRGVSLGSLEHRHVSWCHATLPKGVQMHWTQGVSLCSPEHTHVSWCHAPGLCAAHCGRSSHWPESCMAEPARNAQNCSGGAGHPCLYCMLAKTCRWKRLR